MAIILRRLFSSTFARKGKNNATASSAYLEHQKMLSDKYISKISAMQQQWALPEYKHKLSALLDMRWPCEWFPKRNAFKRKVLCHLGPTNSGKTHAAYMRLVQNDGGREAMKNAVYCAPLRLIAMEMYDRLNAEGHPCTVKTGETCMDPHGKIVSPNQEEEENGKQDQCSGDHDAARKPSLLSCTVEMVDLDKEFDVAIIDEIQMMADPQRGWAFTQAFLGLQARELYLCGEEASLPLIERLCAMTGDELVVKRYERLSPLGCDPAGGLGGDLGALRPGDCLVTFSRKNIFNIKQWIENPPLPLLKGSRKVANGSGGGNIKQKKMGKCAIIYGKLPMENRRIQAHLFNNPVDPNERPILVASDAIGMGLNLNIQRIVFEKLEKFDGEAIKAISMHQIKQIAGRAGRFGFGTKKGGLVTCLHDKDLSLLKSAISSENPVYKTAGIQPPLSVIEKIGLCLPGLSLVSILNAICEGSKYDESLFFPSISQDQKMLAMFLEQFTNLSLSQRYTLSSAPIKLSEPLHFKLVKSFLDSLNRNTRHVFTPVLKSEDFKLLVRIEDYYQILDLYLWLSVRHPNIFGETDHVMSEKKKCVAAVERYLRRPSKNHFY